MSHMSDCFTRMFAHLWSMFQQQQATIASDPVKEQHTYPQKQAKIAEDEKQQNLREYETKDQLVVFDPLIHGFRAWSCSQHAK